MFEGLRTVIYPVADLARAKQWYTSVVGHEPYFDQPFYVGYNVGGYELGLLPQGESAASGGPITYWGVPDIEQAHAHLLSQGAAAEAAIEDVGDGIKVTSVRDPFGNAVGIIYNPHFKLPA